MKIMFLFFTVFALGLAAPNFKTNTSNLGVIGGDDASRNEFPYQLSYQYKILTVWEHVCGASIISETWVLTAGHCIKNTNLQKLRIIAGILNLDDGDDIDTKQILEIAQQIVHEDYKGGVGPNDIGLIEVTTEFNFNDAIQMVLLPPSSFETIGDAILSGWGSTGGLIIHDMPNTLQKVIAPIVENEECNEALNHKLPLSNEFDFDSNMCTGPLSGGIFACEGDSGGPLVLDGKIVGLVSWGIMPCGRDGSPTVYTKVSNFIEWIEEHLGGNLTSTTEEPTSTSAILK